MSTDDRDGHRQAGAAARTAGTPVATAEDELSLLRGDEPVCTHGAGI